MNIFQVVHVYDEDGGFGDAIRCEKVVAVFESEEDAKAFVERFARPHVYDKPYAYLMCGELDIWEINVIQHKDFDLENWNENEFSWNSGYMKDEYEEEDSEDYNPWDEEETEDL